MNDYPSAIDITGELRSYGLPWLPGLRVQAIPAEPHGAILLVSIGRSREAVVAMRAEDMPRVLAKAIDVLTGRRSSRPTRLDLEMLPTTTFPLEEVDGE